MPAPRRLLEVPIASVEDARAALPGADRLELNAALELGGLSPSMGLLLGVRTLYRGPLVVMARPRPGGFCYSASEWDTLYRDAALALEIGAEAIAFGALTERGEIDEDRVGALMRLIGPQEGVFHRAFDLTPDPAQALEQLIALGVKRVLTSGQAASAVEGARLLCALHEQARGRIEVLPAAGIRPENVRDLLARTGCTQVHASLRAPRCDPSSRARPQLRFGTGDEGRFGGTCPELVREMRRALDAP